MKNEFFLVNNQVLKKIIFLFFKKVKNKSCRPEISIANEDSPEWGLFKNTQFLDFWERKSGHVLKSVKIKVQKIAKLKIFENQKFKCTTRNTYHKHSWPPNIRSLLWKMARYSRLKNRLKIGQSPIFGQNGPQLGHGSRYDQSTYAQRHTPWVDFHP